MAWSQYFCKEKTAKYTGSGGEQLSGDGVCGIKGVGDGCKCVGDGGVGTFLSKKGLKVPTLIWQWGEKGLRMAEMMELDLVLG